MKTLEELGFEKEVYAEDIFFKKLVPTGTGSCLEFSGISGGTFIAKGLGKNKDGSGTNQDWTLSLDKETTLAIALEMGWL